MKKKFIKTPLVGVQVHGAKDVGTRTVNLLMGEHAGEYVRGDIMDANAVIQAFDELKGNVDNNHDSLEEIVNEIHNFRDTTNHKFDVFQEKAEEETANRIQGDNTLDEKINAEKQERVNANTQLSNDLTTEINRAKASENTLASDIQAEVTKRENDDNTIKDNLNAEVTRATAKENEIKAEVDVINGDSATEGSFRKAIADVVGAAPEAYDTLKEIADKLNENDDLHAAINDAIATKATTVALNEEITRSKAAEAENKAEIAAEAARAKQAEGNNALAIQNEASRATTAETAINEVLNTEIDRAKGQEAYLQNLVNAKADTTALDSAKSELDNKISDETTRATGVEATKASADDLTAEIARAQEAEEAITSDVTEKLAQKADTTALSNYVLTTALNQQVDTLNAAISAKQDAGNYIPYVSSTALQYVIDKNLCVTDNNEEGVSIQSTNVSGANQDGAFYLDCSQLHFVDFKIIYEGQALRTTYSINGITSDKYNNCLATSDGTFKPISDFALKTELPTVPTNVSQLTNDSNFITQQDADAKYALANSLNTVNDSISSLRVDLSKKQNKITANDVDITDIETADITKLRTIVIDLIDALSTSGLIRTNSGLE